MMKKAMTQQRGPLLELNYVPTPPWHRQRAARVAVRFGLICVVAITAAFCVPTAWRFARIAWWEHACSVYSVPAGLIAFETDPARAKQLLATDHQYSFTEDGNRASLPASGIMAA